jgi:23S rRNA (uracil1939-C5)-methyltransferase
MQHADPSAQIAYKQRILEDNLERIGRVKAEQLLPTIQGPSWGYRHRSRISVRLVEKKGGVLVGFHERNSSFITDMRECHILPVHVSKLIVPLKEMIFQLSIRDRLPQIEFAVGERTTVLVFRILEPLTEADEALFRAFAEAHQVEVWMQTKGPDTVARFWPETAPELSYRLPEFSIEMPFAPTEFTQVNPGINQVLVSRAMRLLAPRPGEKIADLFCGLGNFSLPIARLGAQVLGIEGSPALVKRATANATRHQLDHLCRFEVANLFEVNEDSLSKTLEGVSGLLIDPPRDGAMEVVKSIHRVNPSRIVYVSCNPATLARDAQVLVHQHGYRLRAAGVANMFPHTAHVESIALFTR